jgi:glycosyltransferase involved in cell wall biosynthesis
MEVPVLFISYNRLPYTKQALEALLKTTYPIKIFIWDNGSTDGTREWLADLKGNPKIDYIVLHDVNEGINFAFNTFIRKYKDYHYGAKVDNDTLVQPDWLDKLTEVMDTHPDLDACGAFMQRPPGQWSFQGWVDGVMRKEFLPIRVVGVDGDVPPHGDTHALVTRQDYLAYNSYTGGTGVVFDMRVFWEEGLLFDGYPCKLGDWTTFQRLLFEKKGGNNIAWYSGTTVKLLNIKEDGKLLNEDFPEYEEELRKERDRGNEWYTKIGGPQGVARFIIENGGRERLHDGS